MMAIPLGMALGLQARWSSRFSRCASRVTSMSMAYSVTLALAGGTAPLVAGWLIDTLNSRWRPRITSSCTDYRTCDHVADERNERPKARRLGVSFSMPNRRDFLKSSAIVGAAGAMGFRQTPTPTPCSGP
jgi:hypothetical protein